VIAAMSILPPSLVSVIWASELMSTVWRMRAAQYNERRA
jgi:hypothetical protein